ncbi:zinc metallopeptidase [Stieleria marina]|uniref:Neutral zinc metallopeptidase n=1 Tax=Stieleria marina TaxID=1930275 RepID=A0A517NQJ6_9BACT|nr:Putative neutral zinc metallopeptidase [Planctomycetes bacterium K23_9]
MMMYLVFVIPPMLLGMYAQWRVKSAFSSMSQVPARMSGAESARRMLDSAGLTNVGIEQVGGRLSDHYDPRAKVLRLSSDVYNGRSMAALGVACHEAGHAFQDAQGYMPLKIRAAAVPAASFGSGAGMYMLFGGMLFNFQPLMIIGVIVFSAVVFFQLITLPVEFDASRRARQQLVDQGMIAGAEERYVAKVLNAAALTYVAATLQSVMTLLYYVMIIMSRRD